MQCKSPLKIYISNEISLSGKREVYTNKAKLYGKIYEGGLAPCGQCRACRRALKLSWAVRIMHEEAQWENSCFITLTFNNDNLQEYGSLVKADFQKFMKKLRKSNTGVQPYTDKNGRESKPIRYYHCGEYGQNPGDKTEQCKLGRPHHHAILFNFKFKDMRFFKKDKKTGIVYYRSQELERLWPHGYSIISVVTKATALYVAGYVQKKITGNLAKGWYRHTNTETGEINQMVPEYSTMSLKPGIGHEWYQDHKHEPFQEGFIPFKGYKIKPPKYYAKLYETEFPDLMREFQTQQRIKAKALSRKDHS